MPQALNSAKFKIRARPHTHCGDCAIRRLALFHGVPADQLEWTQGFRSAQLDILSKHNLMDEGETPESLYTLYRGWALVYKTLPNGKRQILRIALPGDLLGYQMDMVGPSDVTIRTLTPAIACAFPRAKFWEYLDSHPELMRSLNRMNAYYMSVCQHYLMGIGRKSALERVGFLLMDLWSRGRDLGEIIGFSEQDGLEFPLSQEDMGDAIGISSVHVNRTLREMREDGLIELDSRHLKVLDETTLSEIAHFDTALATSRYSIFS